MKIGTLIGLGVVGAAVLPWPDRTDLRVAWRVLNGWSVMHRVKATNGEHSPKPQGNPVSITHCDFVQRPRPYSWPPESTSEGGLRFSYFGRTVLPDWSVSPSPNRGQQHAEGIKTGRPWGLDRGPWKMNEPGLNSRFELEDGRGTRYAYFTREAAENDLARYTGKVQD